MVRRRATLLLLIAAGCAAWAPLVGWNKDLPEVDVALIEDLPWDRSFVETQSALATTEPRVSVHVSGLERAPSQRLLVDSRRWQAELYFDNDRRAVQEILIFFRGPDPGPDVATAAAIVARLPRRFPGVEVRRSFAATWRVPGGELTVGVGKNEGRWLVRELFDIAATGVEDERMRPLAEGEDPEAVLASFQPRFGQPLRTRRRWDLYTGPRNVEISVETGPSPLSDREVQWRERIVKVVNPAPRKRP